MSHKGDCWDVAVVESLFHMPKSEGSNPRYYRTREEVKTDIFNYIDGFYNRLRRYSYLGSMRPVRSSGPRTRVTNKT